MPLPSAAETVPSTPEGGNIALKVESVPILKKSLEVYWIALADKLEGIRKEIQQINENIAMLEKQKKEKQGEEESISEEIHQIENLINLL